VLVTVVIPLYNKANTVKRALDSVLNQTTLPIEIIVVNDGSTDGSELLVQQLNNTLIRLINQDNAGVSAARNKGIDAASGDWIAFLDADDYWDEGFLQVMNSLHVDLPKANVLASNYRYQNVRGEFSNTRIKNLLFGNNYFGIIDNYFEVAAVSSPPLWSSAIVVKKSALLNIGKFPLGVTSGEDLITWAKLALNFKIAYTAEPLSTYVLDMGNCFNDKPKRALDSNDVVGKELEALLRDNPETKSLSQYISHWYDMCTSVALRNGNKMQAVKYIRNSLKKNPWNKKSHVFLLLVFLPVDCFFLAKRIRGFLR